MHLAKAKRPNSKHGGGISEWRLEVGHINIKPCGNVQHRLRVTFTTTITDISSR